MKRFLILLLSVIVFGSGLVFASGIVKLGDVNNDGIVDVADITHLIRYLLDPSKAINVSAADANRDGKINTNDLSTIAEIIISGTTAYAGENTPAEARAIDLGLSVRWANMNIGATSVTDYGTYFAWGETKGYTVVDASSVEASSNVKTIFTWETYSYCKGSELLMTKYVQKNRASAFGGGFYDDKTTLDYSDDAARVNWGGAWRMPNKDDYYELINNTKREFTTVNGVKGVRYTSTVSGYTDKSIFLPAAGYRNDMSFLDMGFTVCYWLSTLDSFYAYRALTTWGDITSVNRRCYGLPVRAVQSK